jgi:hypothetical protein
MIARQSSVCSRARRASRDCGGATTRTRGPATPSSPTTRGLAVRGSWPTNGRALVAVTRPTALCVTVGTNGREATMAMAAARSMATPVGGVGAALRTDLLGFRGHPHATPASLCRHRFSPDRCQTAHVPADPTDGRRRLGRCGGSHDVHARLARMDRSWPTRLIPGLHSCLAGSPAVTCPGSRAPRRRMHQSR